MMLDKIVIFCRDKESGEFSPVDQGGFLYSHDLCKEYIFLFQKYMERFNDAYINLYNRNVQLERESEYRKVDRDYKNIESIRKTPGYFYIIKGGGLYKIGITKNLKLRVQSYKTHTSDNVLIFSIYCMNRLEIEKSIKEWYICDHKHGEWYDFSTNVQEVIENVKAISEEVKK